MQILPDLTSSLRSIFIELTGGTRKTPRPGPGVARANARLAAHRARFAGVDLTPTDTRQQRRAEERSLQKILRSHAKASAMSTRQPGGSAACR